MGVGRGIPTAVKYHGGKIAGLCNPSRLMRTWCAHPAGSGPPCDQGESGRRYAPVCSPTHRPPTRGQPRGHQAGAGPRGHPGGGESSGRTWGPSVQSGEPHAPAMRALCCTPSFSAGCSPGHPHLSPLSPRQPPHPRFFPASSPRTCPLATPPLQGGRAVAPTAPFFYPPRPPQGGWDNASFYITFFVMRVCFGLFNQSDNL